MFNDRDNDHTSKLCSDTLTLPNVAHADFTAKLQRAKAASDALKANEKHSFDLAQLFGTTKQEYAALLSTRLKGQTGCFVLDIARSKPEVVTKRLSDNRKIEAHAG